MRSITKLLWALAATSSLVAPSALADFTFRVGASPRSCRAALAEVTAIKDSASREYSFASGRALRCLAESKREQIRFVTQKQLHDEALLQQHDRELAETLKSDMSIVLNGFFSHSSPEEHAKAIVDLSRDIIIATNQIKRLTLEAEESERDAEVMEARAWAAQ